MATIPTNGTVELLQRVDSTIKTHPHVPGHINFSQDEPGVLILHGKVKTFFQKQMAQEVLRRLDGVERIVNQLEVDWSTPVVTSR